MFALGSSVQVFGSCHADFAEIEYLFRDLWQSIEVGAAVSIYHRGQCVVNLWGGYCDKEHQTSWQQDTLVNVYSITKGVVAVAIARLVAAELLQYNAPVSKYWPEFAQNGKRDVTVAQLLSHQAGLCGIRERLSVEDLFDWQKMTDLLAAQAPLWEPGTQAGYHAVTWGYLAGELIRRVTGLTPGQFIREDISTPLGLDFHLGLNPNLHGRCADIIGPNHIPRDKLQQQSPANSDSIRNESDNEHSELFTLAQLNPVISPYKHASSSSWRRAEIPASNGHSDAHSLAKLYGILAAQEPDPSGWHLDQKTLARATRVAVENQTDLVMNQNIRRSVGGFILSHDGNYGFHTSAFGHAGAGGSMAFADPEHQLGFAYVMNQLQPAGFTPRYGEILNKIHTLIA